MPEPVDTRLHLTPEPEDWKGERLSASQQQLLLQGLDQTHSFEGSDLWPVARRSVVYLDLLFRDGRGDGTGFLIAPDLILTARHNVSHSKYGEVLAITANFDRDATHAGVSFIVRGVVAAQAETAEEDWAVVRIERPATDRVPFALGTNLPIIEKQPVTVFQHPGGREKRWSVGALQYTDGQVFQYLADTQSGSSGSPVLNAEMHCIALHHAGPTEEDKAKGHLYNEGIRIERVMEGLRAANVPFNDDPDAYIAQLRAQLAARSKLSMGAPPTPPAAPTLFGRDAFLDDLAAGLIADGGPPVALHGLPGVGKTALALALAAVGDVTAAFPDGRAWLPVGPDPVMLELLGRALEQFGVTREELEGKGEDARADRLRAELADRRCLLILDDVWKAEHARPFLNATRPPARVLFTTRYENMASDLHATDHAVRVLKTKYALEVLSASGAHAAQAVAADDQGARDLAETLGALPLALHVAGRQLDRLARGEGASMAVRLLSEDVTKRLLDMKAAGQSSSVPGVEEPTLDAILAASYDRLPGDDVRSAFRRLAVFGGQPADFDAAAMAAVWDVDEATARDLRLTLIDAGLLDRSESFTEEAPRYALHQIIALIASDRLSGDAAAHARHAAHYLAAMNEADDAGHFYTMRPDLSQILAALKWADESNNLGLLLALLGESADLLHHFGADRERVAAAEKAVALAEAEGDSGALGRALGARANAYSALATVQGEDRRARLTQALADFDAALPLLTATPLDYAQTLNNRANAYSALATVQGEDRRARLTQALADFDAALPLRQATPLDYAATLNNRANVYRDLATVQGEDRRARLTQALADCDEAKSLQEAAPLGYAATLGTRAQVRRSLATIEGEDSTAWLRAALEDIALALALFSKYQQAVFAEFAMRDLQSFRDEIVRAFGIETFAAWWAEVTGGQPIPEWLAAAPVAPPPEETQRLANLLIAWIETPDWESSEQYITEHQADLLIDTAEAVMGMLMEVNPGNATVEQHAALLRRCREVGVAAAYREMRREGAAGGSPATPAHPPA